MKPTELPLVSVVIPVYNGANYMREAIDSALNQTYPNVEIIVVNDGSTDGGETHKVALSYGDKIRYFKKENGGVSSALNYGIKQMKGRYFNWLSHDDIHLPQKIEKQMNAVFSYKGIKPIVCICNFILIDEKGVEFARPLNDFEKYFKKSSKVLLGADINFIISGDATLINKELFDTYGMFDESLFAAQETDIWYRLSDVAEFIFIPDHLVKYRIHCEAVTHKRKEDIGLEAGAYRGNLIKQATIQDIKDYYDNEHDARQFGVSAYHYMHTLFFEASYQIISKLRQLCAEDWHLLPSALKGMFGNEEISDIHHILKTDVSVKSEKKKILVYCKEWNEDGLAKKLTEFMENHKSDVEFILVYCGEEYYPLPKHISSICFKETHFNTVSTHLALLAELLKVDIYWCNTAYFLSGATSINYLKHSKIRIITSFHNLEPCADVFSTYLIEEDYHTPLLNSTIITHEQHYMTFAQYIYPYDAISMPPLSSEPEVCEKWNLLFNTILVYDSFEEELHANFAVSDNVDYTISLKEAQEHIQPYLEKHKADVLEKHRIYYENSLYWRVTRPLRIAVCLIRRITGKI